MVNREVRDMETRGQGPFSLFVLGLLWACSGLALGNRER